MVGSDGEEIGELEQVWVDKTNGLPEWALVKMSGILGRSRYVPLRAAEFGEGQVKVNYTKNEVKGAPDFDPRTLAPTAKRRSIATTASPCQRHHRRRCATRST